MANVTVLASSNIQVANRCCVRTSGNRVYVFLTNNVPNILARKGNQDGEPSSFTTADFITITGLQNVGVAASIDANNIVHIIYYQIDISHGGIIAARYVTFDTSNDTFGTPETIALLDNSVAFIQKLGMCVDANNIPHVFWRDALTSMGSTTFSNYYSNRIGGSWNTKVTVSSNTADTRVSSDIMVADPASSVNADRPIIIATDGPNNAVSAFHGNNLNATSFTQASDITGAINVATDGYPTLVIDSNEKITVGFQEATSFDLMIVEHLNSSAWGTWQTPVDVDTTRDYVAPSIAINGTNRYIYVESSADDDLRLFKDEGAGWSEETADPDLPNVGTFNDVKARWASKNFNSPTELDYIFEDSSGNVLYNTFSASGITTVDKTHMTDTLVQVIDNNRTHNTDSLIQVIDNNRTHNTDALIQVIDNNRSHLTDIFVKVIDNNRVHQTDSLIQVINNDKSHTTDVLIVQRVTKEHLTDILIKAALDKTHQTDVLVKVVNNDRTHNTDSLIQVVDNDRTHLTDTLVFVQFDKSHTTDSLIQVIDNNLIHSTDSLIEVINNDRIHNTDSLIQVIFDRFHTTDSLIQVIDNNISHLTDTLIQVIIDKQHTTDSLIKVINIDKTHSTDILIEVIGAIDVSHQTDTLIKVINNNRTHSTDSLIQVADNDKSHQTDTLIFVEFDKQFTTDTLVKVIDNNRVHNTDVLVKVIDNQVSHLTDTLIRVIQDRLHQTDVLIQVINNNIIHTTDSLIQIVADEIHTTDSLILAALDRSHSTDVFIQGDLGVVSKTHSTDILIRAITDQQSDVVLPDRTTDITLPYNRETDVILVDRTTDITLKNG